MALAGNRLLRMAVFPNRGLDIDENQLRLRQLNMCWMKYSGPRFVDTEMVVMRGCIMER
jgi:hypothetical protein